MLLELTPKAEQSLKKGILSLIADFLKSYTKPKPRQLGLMTARQVKEELEISSEGLTRWERAGLKRYSPPIENTRKVYYKEKDILVFLGVEK